MNTIFKYTMITFGIYFTVNWVADNPAKLNEIRQKMNIAISDGTAAATRIAKDNLQ